MKVKNGKLIYSFTLFNNRFKIYDTISINIGDYILIKNNDDKLIEGCVVRFDNDKPVICDYWFDNIKGDFVRFLKKSEKNKLQIVFNKVMSKRDEMIVFKENRGFIQFKNKWTNNKWQTMGVKECYFSQFPTGTRFRNGRKSISEYIIDVIQNTFKVSIKINN